MEIVVYNNSKLLRLIPTGRLLTFKELLEISPRMVSEHFRRYNNLILSDEAKESLKEISSKIREEILSKDLYRKNAILRRKENSMNSSDHLQQGNSVTIKCVHLTGIMYGI